MQYSKIKQWDAMENDFNGLDDDEELLFILGNRKYVVRIADESDIKKHLLDSLLKGEPL